MRGRDTDLMPFACVELQIHGPTKGCVVGRPDGLQGGLDNCACLPGLGTHRLRQLHIESKQDGVFEVVVGGPIGFSGEHDIRVLVRVVSYLRVGGCLWRWYGAGRPSSLSVPPSHSFSLLLING